MMKYLHTLVDKLFMLRPPYIFNVVKKFFKSCMIFIFVCFITLIAIRVQQVGNEHFNILRVNVSYRYSCYEPCNYRHIKRDIGTLLF